MMSIKNGIDIATMDVPENSESNVEAVKKINFCKNECYSACSSLAEKGGLEIPKKSEKSFTDHTLKEPNIPSVLKSAPESSEENVAESKVRFLWLQEKTSRLNWAEQLNVNLIIEEEEMKEKTEFDIVASDPSDLHNLLKELQFGIKKSLEKLHSYPDRDLLIKDFQEIGNDFLNMKEQRDRGFFFKTYASVAFRYFRKIFDISTENFMNSVCDSPLYPVNSCSCSGSLFFTTRDDRFILKTISKKEAEFLIELFPGYYLNLHQHRKTLLPKYYGLYCHVRAIKYVRVLIMNNILPSKITFCEKYDLKGSTYSKRKQLKNPVAGSSACKMTLKDLDFIEKYPEGFFLQHGDYETLMKSIERDCRVLQSYNIMDYSLLLGIVYNGNIRVEIKKSTEHLQNEKKVIGPLRARTSKDEEVFLFVGIIDILQSYTWKKKVECAFKSLVYSKKTVSVNQPDFYSQRFQNFLKEHVFKSTPQPSPSIKRECCLNFLEE